jgi:hypothetical protein
VQDAENNLQKKRRQQDKEEMKKQMEALVRVRGLELLVYEALRS